MSAAMLLPSRIATMTLRSTTAIDCNSFSTELRRAICSGVRAGRCCACWRFERKATLGNPRSKIKGISLRMEETSDQEFACTDYADCAHKKRGKLAAD